MLISVPFGFREAIVHPITGKVASQVFDFPAIEEGIVALKGEVTSKVEVFAARGTGWELTNPSTCNLRYADGCPAASAVALIHGTKR